MNWLFSVFLILIVSLIACDCISTPESDSYVAAVVELRRSNLITGSTAEQILNNRLNDYINYINHLDAINVDIIIFPDGTLNEDLNLPQKLPSNITATILPCDNNEFIDSIAIQRLSCTARDAQKYIVTNMIGLINSTNEIYNVNVVFNRLGQIISIYRYYNLQSGSSAGLSTLDEPEISYFDTDFGVRFGHLITRDLISLEPAQSLLNLGIRDFVFPNKWQTILPFLAGTQAQQAWSFTNSVNLLAASQNEPNLGSTGSGIYSGRAGPLKMAISGTENFNGVLLVSRISKTPGQLLGQIGEDGGIHPPIYQNTDRITLIRDDNLEDYIISPLFLWGFATRTLCVNNFCCNMAYEVLRRNVAPNTVSYEYAFLLYNGYNSRGGFSGGKVQACAIIACTNSSELSTCGTRFPAGTIVDQDYVFNGIGIGGTFLNDNNLPMATTLSTNLLPIDLSRFTYTQSEPWNPEDGITQRNLSLGLHSNYREPFLTIGIYSHQSTGTKIQSFNNFIGLIIICIVLLMKRLI